MKRTEAILTGGLGNQMFVAATALAVSKRTNAVLQFNLSNYKGENIRKYELDYFKYFESIAKFQSPIRFCGKICNKINLNRGNVFREKCFCYDSRIEKIKGSVKLNGYFQSWRYFEDIQSEVRDIFKPNGPNVVAESIVDSVGPQYISAQVRRGDYLLPQISSFHGLASESFVLKGLSIINNSLPKKLPQVLFSDTPESLTDSFRSNFDFIVDPMLGNHPFNHLYALSESNGLVISNSSFGWWAGYLRDEPNRKVIAPRTWFKKINPKMSNKYFSLDWTRLDKRTTTERKNEV
jgi:hypothetical protein